MQSVLINKEKELTALSPSTINRIIRILRITVACCFIGHGMWGLVSKPGWLPFFTIFSIPEDIALRLMPFIGTIDILVGIAILFLSNKYLLYWTIFWTVFTALLRPLASMGFFEFLERAGNYGPTIALMLCLLSKGPIDEVFRKVEKILRASLFFLLIGHAGLAIIQQPVLLQNLNHLGYPTHQTGLYIFAGFEALLAFTVLIKPRLTGLMFFILLFKLFIESIYPLRGIPYDIFETIERMGDYLIPLVLYIIYKNYNAYRVANPI